MNTAWCQLHFHTFMSRIDNAHQQSAYTVTWPPASIKLTNISSNVVATISIFAADWDVEKALSTEILRTCVRRVFRFLAKKMWYGKMTNRFWHVRLSRVLITHLSVRVMNGWWANDHYELCLQHWWVTTPLHCPDEPYLLNYICKAKLVIISHNLS